MEISVYAVYPDTCGRSHKKDCGYKNLRMCVDGAFKAYLVDKWVTSLENEKNNTNSHLQYGWCSKETSSTKVLRILKHEEKVEVSDKYPKELHKTPRG